MQIIKLALLVLCSFCYHRSIANSSERHRLKDSLFALFGNEPSLSRKLVEAQVAIIAGFGDVIGMRVRNTLQLILGGRSWTNGIDAGYIAYVLRTFL